MPWDGGGGGGGMPGGSGGRGGMAPYENDDRRLREGWRENGGDLMFRVP